VRVIIYTRVSTEQQSDEGISLAAQLAKCRAYSTTYGHDVVDEVQEAASAKTLSRPLLARAIGILESGGADGILVAKLDRLTRSVRDIGTLCTGVISKFSLLSVSEQIDTSSAGGRMMLNIFATMAQWEREVISERTTAAIDHQRSQGTYRGGQPRS